jgi:hypothetical protein
MFHHTRILRFWELIFRSGDAESGSNLQIVRVVDAVNPHEQTDRQVIFFSDGIKGIALADCVNINTNQGCIHEKPPFFWKSPYVFYDIYISKEGEM